MSGKRNEKHEQHGDASGASRGAGLDEAVFRSFCDGAREGILVVEVETKQPVYVNAAFARMFGYTPDEILNLNVTDLHPPETLPSVERDFEMLVKGEMDRSSQTCLRKDGSLFPARIHAWPVTVDGRPCAAGFFEDITETRRMEGRMSHLNAVLRSIRNVNQLITQCRDRDTLLQGACDCLTEARGYGNAWIALLDEERKLVKHFESGLGERFRPMEARLTAGDLTHCCEKALSGEDVVVVEDPPADCPDCPLAQAYGGRTGMTARLAYDGRVYGVLSVSIPPDLALDEEEHDLLAEVAGDIAFALHGLEVEATLNQSYKLLDASQRLAHVGGWEWDVERQRMFWSDEAYRIHGMTPGIPPAGSPEHIDISLACYDPADRPVIESAFRRCATEGQPYDLELPLNRTDGSRIWIKTQAQAVREAGHIVRITGTIMDITERKQAENALKETERLLSQTEYIGNVGGWEFDIDTLEQKWTEGTYRIHEVDLTYENTVENGLEFYTPDSKPIIENAVHRAIEFGEPYDLDLKIVTAKGNLRHVRTIGRIDSENRRLYGFFQDITERLQAEDALRVSEELHRRTLDSIGDAVISTDADGRVKTMNPVAENLTGWRGENAAGRPLSEVFRIVNANTRETVENPVAKVIASGRVAGLANHTILIAREGTERQIADSAAPIRNAAGEILGVVLAFRDVTDEYAAAERLRESEEKYRLLFENESDAIFIVDGETHRILDANRAAEELYGYSKEELCSLCAKDLSAEPENTDSSINDSIRQGSRFVGSRQHKRKDGALLDVEISGTRFTLGGRTVNCSIIRDITERKKAETALRESETWLGETARIARVGGWKIDLLGNTLAWTDETFRIHELPVGAPPNVEEAILFYHADDRPRVSSAVQQAIENGEDFAFEARIVTAKQNLIWVRAIGHASFHDGSIDSVWGTIQDITEQKQVQERLRQMDKMDAIGQLAGGVAHDFNNQLAGIMGYADMLRGRLDEPELQRFAENVLVGARRAGDLTKKLLAFARKGQYESVPVDLHEIVHEVVEFLNHSIDKRIEIKQLLTANPSVTRGDPSQLQNALLNLALNASDAMPEGGEIVFETAVVHLDDEYCASLPYEIVPGPYLRVSVTDTGCGIPKENLERVFEPFFTTKEVGTGTGMGLAAVYGTVKQHGGAVNVYSEVGHGTSFKVFLPVEEEAAQRIKRSTDTIRAPRAATILVVDDEELIRTLAEDMLTSLGYTVKTKKHGESGVSYYDKHWREIDLVILDMVMPRMNGPEAYRTMKAINPEVKVLLASGYSINGAAQDLLAEGVRGFIQKPFDRTELSAKVAEALQDAVE